MNSWLSLSYSVRYELFTPWYQIHDRMSAQCLPLQPSTHSAMPDANILRRPGVKTLPASNIYAAVLSFALLSFALLSFALLSFALLSFALLSVASHPAQDI